MTFPRSFPNWGDQLYTWGDSPLCQNIIVVLLTSHAILFRSKLWNSSAFGAYLKMNRTVSPRIGLTQDNLIFRCRKNHGFLHVVPQDHLSTKISIQSVWSSWHGPSFAAEVEAGEQKLALGDQRFPRLLQLLRAKCKEQTVECPWDVDVKYSLHRQT